MIQVLGLIPARGGSKGIPDKNIIDLNGKPLIEYTIQAARHSAHLSNVVVSTDSSKIASVAQSIGANVPFVRPKELSHDSSGAIGVIEHAIEYFKETGHFFEYIAYLQPTSPLRTAQDIDNAINIAIDTNADAVVSVMDVPHQFGLESLMIEEASTKEHWVSPALTNQPLRRQEKPHYVARNGPAIVITKPETIKQYGNLYGEKTASYKMPTNRSADIDNSDDLEYVQWLMQKNKHSFS